MAQVLWKDRTSEHSLYHDTGRTDEKGQKIYTRDGNGDYEYVLTNDGYMNDRIAFGDSRTTSPSSAELDNGTDSDFEASDFASTTNLPDWASEWIEGASDKYSGDIWSSYQRSLANLSKAPKYTELARKASESQYYSDAQRQLAAASRTGAASMAAAGTTESSIGTDYITNLAANAVKLAQTQQETNVKAAESDYQNLVDTAAATQGFSSLLSEYLSATYEKTEVDLGDLDMSAGFSNPDGGGGYDPEQGIESGQSYGTDLRQYDKSEGGMNWEAPEEWAATGNKKQKYPGPSDDPSKYVYEYKYNGQTFWYYPGAGTVSDISGSPDGTGGTEEATDIDSADFAATSGLEDFSAEAIKNIFEKYGTEGLDQAVSATGKLSAAGNKGGFIDQKSQGLTNQYGSLSSRTMKMLQSALGTAGLTGAGVGARYSTANTAAIGEEALVGRNTVANATKSWNAALKTQNLTDAANANNSLATLIGDYLGLAKYSYDPGYDDYVNFSKGTSSTTTTTS